MQPLRTALETHWQDLGIEPGEFCGMSLMLCDSYLVGQRLRWEQAQAVWFSESDEAKLFDSQGRLLVRLQGLSQIAPAEVLSISQAEVVPVESSPVETVPAEIRRAA